MLEARATPFTNLSSSFSHRKCRESSAANAAKIVFMVRSVTIGSYITRHTGTGLPAAFQSCVKGEKHEARQDHQPGVQRSKLRSIQFQAPQNVERVVSAVALDYCAGGATERAAKGTQTQPLSPSGFLSQ